MKSNRLGTRGLNLHHFDPHDQIQLQCDFRKAHDREPTIASARRHEDLNHMRSRRNALASEHAQGAPEEKKSQHAPIQQSIRQTRKVFNRT